MTEFSFDDAAAGAGMLGEDDLRARLTQAEEVLRAVHIYLRLDDGTNHRKHGEACGIDACILCLAESEVGAYFEEIGK